MLEYRWFYFYLDTNREYDFGVHKRPDNLGPRDTGKLIELWGAGANLLTDFMNTSSNHDGGAAGLLGDWCEENAELFPEEYRAAVMKWARELRERHRAPENNQPVTA